MATQSCILKTALSPISLTFSVKECAAPEELANQTVIFIMIHSTYALIQQEHLQAVRFLLSTTVLLLSSLENHPSNSITFSIQSSCAPLHGCKGITFNPHHLFHLEIMMYRCDFTN